MFCTYCGQKLTDKHQFCDRCGKPVRRSNGISGQMMNTPVDKAEQENVARNTNKIERDSAPPAKTKNSKILPFCLLFVGIIILAAGLWFMLKPSKEEPEDTSLKVETHRTVDEPAALETPQPAKPEPEPVSELTEDDPEDEILPEAEPVQEEEPVPEEMVLPEPPSIGPMVCEVEIENLFRAPLHVYRGNEEVSVIAGQSSATLTDLPEGTELTVHLFAYDVTEPYSYTCNTGYDKITPTGFTLTNDHQIAINNAVLTYINQTIEAYNQRDRDRLASFTSTSLSHALSGDLKNEMALTKEKNGYSYIFQIYPGTATQISSSIVNHSDDAATIDVTYSIPFDYTETYYYKNGDIKKNSDNHTIEHPFVVQYNGASWQIIG